MVFQCSLIKGTKCQWNRPFSNVYIYTLFNSSKRNLSVQWFISYQKHWLYLYVNLELVGIYEFWGNILNCRSVFILNSEKWKWKWKEDQWSLLIFVWARNFKIKKFRHGRFMLWIINGRCNFVVLFLSLCSVALWFFTRCFQIFFFFFFFDRRRWDD